jgi:hypothetical protein
MVRVARCESVLDPCAVNRSGPYYGLFQYLKSTWKTTPYGDREPRAGCGSRAARTNGRASRRVGESGSRGVDGKMASGGDACTCVGTAGDARRRFSLYVR